MFSGYVSNTVSYPKWICWVQWISPVRYSFESLMHNQFGDKTYGIRNINIVKFFGFDLGIAKCLGLLVAITFVLRVISFLFLKYLMNKF